MIIINLKKIRDNITTTTKHNRAGHTQNNANKEKQIDQGKQQNILTKHAAPVTVLFSAFYLQLKDPAMLHFAGSCIAKLGSILLSVSILG
jgi:hypothetical protein